MIALTPVLAQVEWSIPTVPWAAIAPELVLFGTGILVLLLETAGDQRLRVSFLALVGLAGGAGLGWWFTGELVWPVLLAIAGAAQFALAVTWRQRPRVLSALLSVIGTAAMLGVVAWQWTTLAGGELLATETGFGGMVAVDGVALFTRVSVGLVVLLSIPLGWAYLEDRRLHRPEYYPLILFAAVGMNLLAASNDLLMVFIAIEVLSLSLYILTGFAKHDLTSQEGALKYFLLGAFSSAILLYGIALSYGIAGTTGIPEVGAAIASTATPPVLAVLAMAFLVVGFAFKTALVPFHMWTPDVYQAAPTPVTGFMAAATKAAAFAAFLRIFVGALAEAQWSWIPVLWTLAALTMLVGAILAVVQTDLKRMLGYSAIAHAGYALIGIVAANRDGVGATLFYLLVYGVVSVGAFGVLSLLERRERKAVAISDLAGLGRRYPLQAGMFALFLLSLAGIPGTAGFMGKLSVFTAGIFAGQWLLVVIAVVSSVIAAFFYIRVIKAMFMDDEPAALAEQSLTLTPGVSFGLAVTAVVVVVLGVWPTAVVDLATQAAAFAG